MNLKEIKLYNRDRANLKLVKIDDNNKNPGMWRLEVDSEHNYILNHLRIIGKESAPNMNVENWEAIDPSGGPFIAVGDIYENKYKVEKFINATTLLISENEGNNY